MNTLNDSTPGEAERTEEEAAPSCVFFAISDFGHASPQVQHNIIEIGTL